MTVNILIQIDKLVQLLESPVFTCKNPPPPKAGNTRLLNHRAIDLRLQLLEPEKYPHLYKCLYGLLMLLPQSSAFAALKNRLNSVSSIGYLHIAPRPYVIASHALLPVACANPATSTMIMTSAYTAAHRSAPTTSGSNFDRPNRLKGRDDTIIRWTELLEKFRTVQERARRAQRPGADFGDGPSMGVADLRITDLSDIKAMKEGVRGPPVPVKDPPAPAPAPKARSGLGRQFGRLGGAVSGRGKRSQP